MKYLILVLILSGCASRRIMVKGCEKVSEEYSLCQKVVGRE